MTSMSSEELSICQ